MVRAMGEASGVFVDIDDLRVTASVLEAMASASADGWAAVSEVQNALREQWMGARSVEFDRHAEDLVDRARSLLRRMDQVVPDLRAAVDGYVETDMSNAEGVAGDAQL